MKRNREVIIIVEALSKNKLIDDLEIENAKIVISEAIKNIRREKYAAHQKTSL